MEKRKHKSISGILKSKKTYQSQQKSLIKWSGEWEKDQSITIDLIQSAIKEGRNADALIYIEQLRAITDKRFTGLHNIASIVSNPDRQLHDERNDVYVTIAEAPLINVASKESASPEQDREEIEPDPSGPHYTLERKPNIDIRETKEIDIDEIVNGYRSGMSVRELAQWNNVNWQKITKILVTENVYTSEIFDKIKELREAGKSDWEIMDSLDIKKNTLNIYTPYKKSVYNLQNASETAIKLRAYRKKLNLS